MNLEQRFVMTSGRFTLAVAAFHPFYKGVPPCLPST
jgi:hypothetical protein